jgi:hypothetical protein
MTLREMTKAFKVTGQWALQTAPGTTVPGELSYTPERCELALAGSFQPFPSGLVQSLATVPIIHGITTEGEPFSLLNPVRGQVSTRISPQHIGLSETWVCPLVLSGAHVDAEAPLPALECRIPSLQVWLSQQVITRGKETDEQTGGVSRTYHVRSHPHEVLPVPAIGGELGWITRVDTSGDNFRISAESTGWCKIQPAEPKSVRWYFTQLQAVTALLTFAAGQPMSADLLAFPARSVERGGSVLVPRRDATYCSYTKQYEFFITRPALGEHFGDILKKWFDRYPALANTIQLAISVMGSRNLWQHVEFLSWMQALEGFHRSVSTGLYMNVDDYESVKQTLGNAIPVTVTGSHRDALRSRIRYGNEISLAKRLAELADRIGPELCRRLFGASASIPRAWIDTRNYYTHWDEQSRANLMDGQQIMHANLRLSLFARALYLDFAGFDRAAIQRALDGLNDQSQWLLQINRSERSAGNDHSTVR